MLAKANFFPTRLKYTTDTQLHKDNTSLFCHEKTLLHTAKGEAMFPGVNILDSIFWMFFGCMQIVIIASAYIWLQDYGKKILWWQMTILYSIFAMFCLTIGGGFTLAGEYESQAGWYFIGILGVPLILTFALAVRFFLMRATDKT